MPGFVLAQFTKSIPATAYRALHAVITCGCQRDKSVFPKRLNLRHSNLQMRLCGRDNDRVMRYTFW